VDETPNPGLLNYLGGLNPTQMSRFVNGVNRINSDIAPGRYEGESSWLGRFGLMAVKWNSVNMGVGLLDGGDAKHLGVEPGYSPSDDEYLKSNSWIKSYYPEAWSRLLDSTSSTQSYRMIQNLKKGHADNVYLGHGSVVGNLLAAIPASLVDPINFINPTVGLFKIGTAAKAALGIAKASKAASVGIRSVKARAAINAIDNTIMTQAVGPMMQESDLTYTDEQLMMDTVASAILGGAFPFIGKGVRSGASRARDAAERKILGGKSKEEFIEENIGNLMDEIDNDPRSAKVLRGLEDEDAGNEMLIPSEENWEEAAKIIRGAFEKVQEGSSVIVGTGKGTFFGDNWAGKMLMKFLFLSPNQGLLFHANPQVQLLGRHLVRSNLISGIDSRASLEDLIDYVSNIWSIKQQDLRKIIDEEYLGVSKSEGGGELTAEDIYEAAGILIKLQKETISDTEGASLPSRSIDEVDYDPFEKVRKDDLAIKTIEKVAKIHRKNQQALTRSLEEAGFMTREFDDIHDPERMNREFHVSRELTDDFDEGAFRASLIRGLKENRAKNIDMFTAIRKKSIVRIRSLQHEILLLKAKGSTKDIETSIKNKEIEIKDEHERLNAAKEFIGELTHVDSDLGIGKIADTLIRNYLGKVHTEIGSRSSGSGGTAKQLLSRSVHLDEKYLMPFMVNNLESINRRIGSQVIPKLAMSLENTMVREALTDFSMNQRLRVIAVEMAELRSRLREYPNNPYLINKTEGEGLTPEVIRKIEVLKRFNADKKRFGELVDEARDLSELNNIILQANIIDRPMSELRIRKIGNPDEFYETNKELISDIVELYEARSSQRDEVSKLAIELNEINRKMFIEGIGQSWADSILILRMRERAILQEQILHGPDEVIGEEAFYAVLRNNGYAPLGRDEKFIPGLSELSPEDTANLGYSYTVSKNGTVSLWVTIDGKRVRAAEKSAGMAGGKNLKRDQHGHTFYNFDLEEKLNGKALYVQVKNSQGEGSSFAWLNPLEMKELRKEALEAWLKSGDHDPAAMSKAENDIKRLGSEIEALKKGEGFTPEIKRKAELERIKLDNEIKKLDIEIEGLVAGIKDGTGDKHLVKFHSDHGKVNTIFKDLLHAQEIFENSTRVLNGVVKDITDSTYGIKELEKYTKDFIGNRKEGDRRGDFVGFENRNSVVHSLRWGIRGMSRKVVAGLEKDRPAGIERQIVDDRLLGLRDSLSDYEYTMSRIEQSRKLSAEASLDPIYEIARLARDGELDEAALSKVGGDVKFLYDQLLNKSSIAGNYGGLNETLRILKNMNYMRYMGMVMIASLSDFGNAVGTLGLPRYIRTLWHYIGTDKNNLSELARLNANIELAGLKQSSTGSSGDVGLGSGDLDTTGRKRRVSGKSESVLKKIDEHSGQGSLAMNLYQRANLLSAWNAFNKSIVTNGLEDMVVEFGIRLKSGQKLTRVEEAYARSLRLSDNDLIKIATQREGVISTGDMGSLSRKTIVGRDFYLTGSELWDDASFAHQYRAKITSAANSIIVTPSRGSNPKWTKLPGLDLTWQFKSFLAASFEMTFLPMLQRGIVYKDPSQLMMLLTTTAGGAITYSIYEILGGRDPFEDKVEEKEDGTKVKSHWSRTMAAQGMDRSGVFALLFEANNMFERQYGYGFHKAFTGISSARKYKARSVSDVWFGPTVGGVTEFVTALGVAFNPTDWPTRGELSAMRRLGPAQNTVWARLAFDVGPSLYDSASTGGDYFESFQTGQERLSGN